MADFLDGYERVMAAVRAQHKTRTGSERGAAVWLAKKLGCTRQSIDNYRKRNGFPRRYGAKLMKITGLRPEEIYPGIERAVFFPPTMDDEIVEISRANRQGFSETVVELVRDGLNHRSTS